MTSLISAQHDSIRSKQKLLATVDTHSLSKSNYLSLQENNWKSNNAAKQLPLKRHTQFGNQRTPLKADLRNPSEKSPSTKIRGFANVFQSKPTQGSNESAKEQQTVHQNRQLNAFKNRNVEIHHLISSNTQHSQSLLKQPKAGGGVQGKRQTIQIMKKNSHDVSDDFEKTERQGSRSAERRQHHELKEIDKQNIPASMRHLVS